METETGCGGSMEKAADWLKSILALAGMLALGVRGVQELQQP